MNTLVCLQSGGCRLPIVFIHPAGGQVHWFRALSKSLGKDRPFFSMMSLGLLIDNCPLMSVEELATLYLGFLKEKNISMPCLIAGFSFGCDVAYEMVLRLKEQGYEVPWLILIDPQKIKLTSSEVTSHFLTDVLRKEFDIVLPNNIDPDWFNRFTLDETMQWLRENIILQDKLKSSQELQYMRSLRVYLSNMLAMTHYNPKEGALIPAIYLGLAQKDRSSLYPFLFQASQDSWLEHAEKVVEKELPGDHFSILVEPKCVETISGDINLLSL